MRFRNNLMVAGAMCLLACGPGDPIFFGDPPDNHEFIRDFVDTVLVRDVDADSVNAEGVRWVLYAGDRIGSDGQGGLGGQLEDLGRRLESTVPDSLLDGDAPYDLFARISAQSVVHRMDLMRADALTMERIRMDTVRVAVDSTTSRRWLAVVSVGRAWLNPEEGLRDDVR